MTSSKNELLYFVLTILFIVFAAFIYFTFGRKTASVQPSNLTAQVVARQEAEKKLQTAKASVTNAEVNPNDSSLALAQEAVEQIEDDSKKNELRARLDAVAAEITNQTAATTAVETAEASLSTEDIKAAQEALNQVGNEAKKTELMNRLTAIASSLGYTLDPSPSSSTN
ncbi:hypothetical protein [Streptococcus cuniculipharyngis]|uniref:Uncharacterized protein n=1 Tax=Streptococcus cuniculipharyngis TaxID=1562651 RepID=A0A5C5SB25_9STRE|nr:hypothetical protein [Streptococcus cuniculipharyngis]TWS96669.1 hypothetical protein FRX57_06805 [Streptococcus cuniculipharyngis]